MNTTVTPLEFPGTFRIADLTAQQLDGLKWLLSSQQVDLNGSIRGAEENEAFWVAKIAEGGAYEDQLALCRRNLATFKRHLADAFALVPIIYGAKFVPSRRHP